MVFEWKVERHMIWNREKFLLNIQQHAELKTPLIEISENFRTLKHRQKISASTKVCTKILTAWQNVLVIKMLDLFPCVPWLKRYHLGQSTKPHNITLNIWPRLGPRHKSLWHQSNGKIYDEERHFLRSLLWTPGVEVPKIQHGYERSCKHRAVAKLNGSQSRWHPKLDYHRKTIIPKIGTSKPNKIGTSARLTNVYHLTENCKNHRRLRFWAPPLPGSEPSIHEKVDDGRTQPLATGSRNNSH